MTRELKPDSKQHYTRREALLFFCGSVGALTLVSFLSSSLFGKLRHHTPPNNGLAGPGSIFHPRQDARLKAWQEKHGV